MLKEITERKYGKGPACCTAQELYGAALELCREKTAGLPYLSGGRRLYYLSAEFLMGKLLSCNLLNLGLWDEVERELEAAGSSIAAVEDAEPEPSLGNGGLGRLAACFLDSIATLGLPGDGIGLCYHCGLFRQVLEDRKQRELPDCWMTGGGESWLRPCGGDYTVSFGKGSVQGKLYSIDIPGYGGNGKNRLLLFDLDGVDESLVKDGICFDKKDIARNLTLFLYPDDSDRDGRILRVYQQYFLVSCAAQLILGELAERGFTPRELAKTTVIQINDTHPSMIIPELVRRLCGQGIPFEEAAEIVSHTCAYTNHTILAEALEKWPLEFMEEAVPQLVPVLRRLDAMARAKHPEPELAIIDGENRVHMARLDIHYGFSVNGVAALHTEILKTSELKPFCDIYPEKFNNKTNGITFRRWLMACNPPLSDFITARIGDGWKKDAGELRNLLAFTEDADSLHALTAIKQRSKAALADDFKAGGIAELNPESIFDIQIKRLHEYKRQQMNLLYIIWKYLSIKAGNKPVRPVTVLFGAKAAPAYLIAKDIIHAILCVSQVIASDPEVSPWLSVVFAPNYNVTLAEKLVPAADISEQISLASKEASGTGNMKLMLNGALTLGTLDGANYEIADLVGSGNIYLFGRRSEEVIQLRKDNAYDAYGHYKTPFAEPLVDFLLSKPMLTVGDAECLGRLYQDITHKDWFMALLDLEDYVKVKEQMLADYEDRDAWAKKMLVNIGQAGFFSSDRTIAQYNKDIWKL